MPDTNDTIFALSSGKPPAAIAVVRISGPEAGGALKALIGRIPEPRRGTLGRVRDPVSREIVDEALVLWFPGPNSETGEDTAELQIHGGQAVIARLLELLAGVKGLRPAEAGEFTRRAFENGRLDLAAVEGLADLVGAETEAQRRQAFSQFKGLLGDQVEAWRAKVIEARALIEAGIDFSDEGDVPADTLGQALKIAGALEADVRAALQSAGRGERLREGLVIAIAGPPNAGKSTLLNRLARRDVAIVSPRAGTTRDVIEVHLDLDGFPVTVLDTAGIRETDDPVEREGVLRAKARADAADLVLWVVDADAALTPEATERRWILRNKIDRLDRPMILKNKEFAISAETGTGVDDLVKALGEFASGCFGAGEPALVTRERHRRALELAGEALGRALAILPREGQEDLIAEELWVAARMFGRVTGRVDVEDVLDAIFRDFCIGK